MEDTSFHSTLVAALAREDEHQVNEKRRVSLAAGLALLWCIFTLLAQFSGALNAFEEPLLDWRQSLNSYPIPPSNQFALIAIDNIPPERPWPWSRLDYSLVLRSLIDYAPQSVIFDMNLNDRDTDYTSFDDTFSHIVERANVVLFSATVMTTRDSTTPLPAHLGELPFHGDARQVPRFGSAIWPLQTFAGDSPVGVNNVQAEAGLRLRRLPLVFMLDRHMVPSMVLQATAQLLGADLASSDIQIGRAILLRRKDGKLLRTIPIDDEGRLTVRFHGGDIASWRASFDDVMLFDDQIQHNITPGRDLRLLSNRQVWIGRTDTADRERFNTPLGKLGRVEIEMQAERTILEQDYVRPLPPMILAAFYILIGVGGSAAVVRLGPVHAAVLVVILGAFWLELAVLGFRLYNIVLPLPSFAMLLFGTFCMGLLALYWDLEPEEATPDLPHEVW